MPTHEKETSAAHKREKLHHTNHHTNSDKEPFAGMQDIKENVLGLAQSVRDGSVDKAHMAADYVLDRVDDLKTSGTDALGKVESRIRAKPAQSIAIAFTAGLLASFLFGRRPS